MTQTNGVQVQFVARDNGPERLVCEAEIHFDEGPLRGTKLVGFSLWKGPDGELYVTFPSRAFGAGSERRLWRGTRYGECAAGRPPSAGLGVGSALHNAPP